MQKNYNENLVAGAAIRDDKGRRISKLFEASHPKMTVGYAKNLIMPDTPTEQEFNFRQSGGGVIEDGVAVIDKVKGNSVVWNQLVKNGNFESTAHWGDTLSVSDGVATFIAESQYSYLYQNIEFVSGHQYLLRAEIKASVDGTAYLGVFAGKMAQKGVSVAVNTSSFVLSKTIVSMDATEVGISAWSGAMTLYIRNVNVFDLTKMFGAGNEPSTVEEFEAMFPQPYYAYNEGTIVNNKVEKVVTTGRNLWDEEWELGAIDVHTGENKSSDSYIRSKNYIPIIPYRTYYCTALPAVRLYDGNKKYLGYNVFDDTTHTLTFSGTKWGANLDLVKYARFLIEGTTYNHDICINLSDPAINGQYFPYEKHELDLSWVKDIKDAEGVKLFEDGMKSAGTVFDEVGKNKAVKRLGLVKMKDLNWELNTSYDWGNSFSASLADMKPVGALSYGNILYRLGVSISNDANPNNESYLNTVYGIRGESKIGFVSVIQDVSQLIASFTDEDILIYELTEPIEVEYDEKNLTYPVVAGGTEEAIASEPSTAFHADIGYGIDAVKTILDLKARVEALEGK